MTMMMTRRPIVIVILVDVVIVIVIAHALEQGRLPMRRIVALPRPRKPDLCVFPSNAASAAAAASSSSTRATFSSSSSSSSSSSAAAAASAGAVVIMPGVSGPAIACVSRILEPIARVVLLLLLELERAPLHPLAFPVARTLANVYRRVRAPAVAECFAVFPVARRASECRPRGRVCEGPREGVVQAKCGWCGRRVLRARKLLAVLMGERQWMVWGPIP
jgi:hypothetical protein